MSLAQQIREFIEVHYFAPARGAGQSRVTVNSGGVHRAMQLLNRLPAVCSAMRSASLLSSAGVVLDEWDGPREGSSSNATYSFSPAGAPKPQRGERETELPSAAVHRDSAESVDWSSALPFERKVIESNVPHKPGVYKIMQADEYPRYRGSTRVLKIGMSQTSLQREFLNHLGIHTAANRLARVQRAGALITVVFAVGSPDSAQEHEAALLRALEEIHWELPVLNSQRGYRRGEDAHYRR